MSYFANDVLDNESRNIIYATLNENDVSRIYGNIKKSIFVP